LLQLDLFHHRRNKVFLLRIDACTLFMFVADLFMANQSKVVLFLSKMFNENKGPILPCLIKLYQQGHLTPRWQVEVLTMLCKSELVCTWQMTNCFNNDRPWQMAFVSTKSVFTTTCVSTRSYFHSKKFAKINSWQ